MRCTVSVNAEKTVSFSGLREKRSLRGAWAKQRLALLLALKPVGRDRRVLLEFFRRKNISIHCLAAYLNVDFSTQHSAEFREVLVQQRVAHVTQLNAICSRGE